MRQEILTNMEGLAQRVKGENRNYSEDEKHLFDSWDQDQERLAKSAETLERMERIDGLTRTESQARFKEEVLEQTPGATQRGMRAEVNERNRAMAAWFYADTPHLKPEMWRSAERQGFNWQSPFLAGPMMPHKQAMRLANQRKREERQQVGSTPTAGGDLVATDVSFWANIDIATHYYGNCFEFCTTVDTRTGAVMPYPLTDDSTVFGFSEGEGVPVTQKDMVYSRNQLSAFKQDSGLILVSWELAEDSVLNMSEHVAEQAGKRLGRTVNRKVLNGPGTTDILGVIGQLPVGATTASPTAIGYLDLVAFYHSIDYSYRQEDGAGWVFSDSAWQALRQLSDNNGRPLLMSSLEGIVVDPGRARMLIDKTYYINNEFGTVAATNTVGMFGDLEKIIVRRVTGDTEGGYHLVRLNERYADKMLTGYFVWGRYDAVLSDAGQHPIKKLVMHA
jgi:HK97 family phage major capsid protein